ncbi:MAG: class I SAM-dependent methyltransferase [Caulobacteraceae bacterium]|nr:class I SAM-dependent methyltransferase [Caulobacteraceae bacterium]
MSIRAVVVSFVVAAAGLAASAASPATPGYIAKAVADASRPADDRKLDADRKPGEVLAFAGVRPGQAVVEYLPGGGYYTRLLSDVVGPGGKIHASETTTWGQGNIDAIKQVMAEPGRGAISLDLAPLGTFHPPAWKADLFWISDNYHDLHVPKYAKVDMAVFNKAVFDALKPGGVYLIVDHAAAPGTGATLSPTLHRIDKATVIAEVTAAGFTLAGESDLLRNPADDRAGTIFNPAIHFKTDRFILKFIKP